MDMHIVQGLMRAMERDDRWSITLDGEDPRSFLNDLVNGLKGEEGTGRGKQVPNKHRYVGLSPTISWFTASRDPSYPVTYDSLRSFARLWDRCQPALEDQAYHYVSLGVGTGEKDDHVLEQLSHSNPELIYIGVDISTYMLRLGTAEAARRYPGRVVTIELDFERRRSLMALRRALNEIVGDQPILFSLLGSSLANVGTDEVFLKSLAALLRPDDRLAVEVAIVDALTDTGAHSAAAERTASRLYKEFVTSALGAYTNLTIDTNWLRFNGSLEHNKALRVTGAYHNLSGEPIDMALPNRETTPFMPDESIEVLLGRKYLLEGLQRMMTKAGLAPVCNEHRLDKDDLSAPGETFGLALLLMRRGEAQERPEGALSRMWSAALQPAE